MKESTTNQKEEVLNASVNTNKSSLMQLFELQLKYSAEQELLVAIFDHNE